MKGEEEEKELAKYFDEEEEIALKQPPKVPPLASTIIYLNSSFSSGTGKKATS